MFNQHRFNVEAMWSAPGIDVYSTISSIIKPKQYGGSLLFALLLLFFLCNLFCFLSKCQKVVLLNLLDTKVNPNCLLFSQRERESRRSPVVGDVGTPVYSCHYVYSKADKIACRSIYSNLTTHCTIVDSFSQRFVAG